MFYLHLFISSSSSFQPIDDTGWLFGPVHRLLFSINCPPFRTQRLFPATSIARLQKLTRVACWGEPASNHRIVYLLTVHLVDFHGKITKPSKLYHTLILWDIKRVLSFKFCPTILPRVHSTLKLRKFPSKDVKDVGPEPFQQHLGYWVAGWDRCKGCIVYLPSCGREWMGDPIMIKVNASATYWVDLLLQVGTVGFLDGRLNRFVNSLTTSKMNSCNYQSSNLHLHLFLISWVCGWRIAWDDSHGNENNKLICPQCFWFAYHAKRNKLHKMLKQLPFFSTFTTFLWKRHTVFLRPTTNKANPRNLHRTHWT